MKIKFKLNVFFLKKRKRSENPQRDAQKMHKH